MSDPRPVFLDLLAIRQPLPAWVSILHRASGVLLYLSLPALLMFLEALRAGPAEVAALLDASVTRVALLLFLLAYLYHLLAGLRFLLLDLHLGATWDAARRSAAAVLILAACAAIAVGMWW